MPTLTKPERGTVFFEDEYLYACLAKKPFAKGHVVVAWKKPVPDLHRLSHDEYEELMDSVNLVRDAMLRTFRTTKVYLLYLDEIKHVHWHLIPRFHVKGLQIVLDAKHLKADKSLVPKLKSAVQELKTY